MTAIKQLAPQKRKAPAILSVAQPFLTTSTGITIKGCQIQPWLSSMPTRNAHRWSPPTPPRPDRDAACLVPRRIRAQTTARTKEALPRSEKGPDSPIRTPRAPLTRLLPSQPFRQLPAHRREKLRVVQQIQGLARHRPARHEQALSPVLRNRQLAELRRMPRDLLLRQNRPKYVARRHDAPSRTLHHPYPTHTHGGSTRRQR